MANGEGYILKRVSELKFPRISDHERKVIRLLNVFGYADKEFLYKWLCPGKSRRHTESKRAAFKKYRIFEEFPVAPPKNAKNVKEHYWCIALDETGIGIASDEDERLNDKRECGAWVGNLSHDCMLTRAVMELMMTLEKNGFNPVHLYNDSGEFNQTVLLRPDGTIVFSKDDQIGAFFIEVEKNYMDMDKISKKLNRYSAAIREKKFDAIVGHNLATARLVYIVSEEKKAENLIKKMREIGRKGFDILVATYTDLCENQDRTLYTVPFATQKIQLTRKVNYD